MPDALTEAARAAEKVREWEERRDAALLAARADGASLRALAAALGVSVQTVANWLGRLTPPTP